MIYTDAAAAAAAFREQIDQAQTILLLTHIHPDGDAIGSLLGAYHALRDLGKEPLPLASSSLPSYCLGLPGAEAVRVYVPGTALPEADLIWMLDTATLSRVGAIFDDHSAALISRPLIITDHHVTNDGGGLVNLIDPSASSNAELLFALLQAMGLPVSPAAATCMYMGLITDTQSFQTSSTGARTLRTAADLLEVGANRRLVIDAIYFSIPDSTMRLSALALSNLHREADGLVWVTVSQTQLKQAGAGAEATDDTTAQLQRIVGMRICALFRELEDGTVKLSLRSVPGINVAAIAQLWDGGGHRQAAGVSLPFSLAEAPTIVLPYLRAALTATT